MLLCICFTYININRIGSTDENKYLDAKSTKRYDSIIKSTTILAKQLDDITAFNLINGDAIKLSFKEPTILLVMSGMGCHPCMHREFLNFQKIYKKQFNIISICDEDSRPLLRKVQKIDNIEFPMYYVKNEDLKLLSFTDKYPQILLLSNNQIISAFLPIPDDDAYSEWYASLLVKRILELR